MNHILDNSKLGEFFSPLHGAYDRHYSSADGGTAKLYELGKQNNWNATFDVEWNAPTLPEAPLSAESIGIAGYREFEMLDKEQQSQFLWDYMSWNISQFLHGEQGALLIASQLVSCVPDMGGKMYAASQTFDEARHVEVYQRYMELRQMPLLDISPSVERLLRKILSDERWDLKFIGMQLIIESIALASLTNLRKSSIDPVLNQIVSYILKDESRHVNFGIRFLERHLKSLSPSELAQRAKFCFDACVIMRDRFVPLEIFKKYGWDTAGVRRHLTSGTYFSGYQEQLYCRLIPVLEKVGLITEEMVSNYAMIGALEFRHHEVEF